MRNGILATAMILWTGVGMASAQQYKQVDARDGNKQNPPCACQNQRLFPGLFGWLGKRPPQPRVEPPIATNPQPYVSAVAAQSKQQAPAPASAKVMPAYLPPSIPARATLEPATTPVARVNYDHLLEQSGHDKNYSWITGVLRQKRDLPGVWYIQYLPPDALPDMHGGALPIQTRASFDGLREGDLVTVIGYVITNADVANQRRTAFAADQVNKIQK